MQQPNTSAPQTITLEPSALRLLIAKLPPLSRSSPLHGLALPEAGTLTDKVLVHAGLLDHSGRLSPFWLPALQILCSPQRQVVAIAGAGKEISTLHLYQSSEISPAYVSLGYSGEQIHLSWPLAGDGVIDRFRSLLELTATTSDLGIGVELSLPGLLTLSGLIDGLRELELEALLKRCTDVDSAVAPHSILQNLRQGWQCNDFRWLSPVVRQMVPSVETITEDSLTAGLAELEQAGWIQARTAGEACRFHSSVEAAIQELSTPLVFGALLVLDESGLTPMQGALGMIRCPNSLWISEYHPAPSRTIRLASVSEEIVSAGLDTMMKPRPENPPPPKPHPSPRFCGHCGTPLLEGARFCTGCGQRIGID